MNNTILFVALMAGSLLAQTNQDQSQQAPKDTGKVTMQGCVSRSSGDFILMQTNPGNSFVLDAPRRIRLDHFLGQQVEVTGVERPTMGTSTNFTRRRAGSSVTIRLDSIKTVSQRCGS
jgi:hypothetical protein